MAVTCPLGILVNDGSESFYDDILLPNVLQSNMQVPYFLSLRTFTVGIEILKDSRSAQQKTHE